MRCAGNEHATAERLVGARGRAKIGWGIHNRARSVRAAQVGRARADAAGHCRTPTPASACSRRVARARTPRRYCAKTIGTLTAAQGRRGRSCTSPSGSRATGSDDERAVALLAGPVVRTHSVALAAELRELDGSGAGPVYTTALTLEELRGEEEPREGRHDSTASWTGTTRTSTPSAGARLGRTGWRRWACIRAGPQGASGACSTGSGDGVRRQHDAAAGEAQH